LESAVLFPCSDGWAEAAAGLPAALQDRFRPIGPDPEVVAVLVDKRRFAERLVALDVPHPWTRAVDDPSDLDEVPDEQLARCFLKPVDSQAFNRAFGLKAVRSPDREEASRFLRLARSR